VLPRPWRRNQGRTSRTPVVSSQAPSAAVLIDFDNFYPDADIATGSDWLTHELNKIITVVLAVDRDVEFIDIRLYGGWLDNGLLTRHASELQAALGASPIFPLAHPYKSTVLRGEVALVTRLAGLPSVQWAHTRRVAVGLPQIRLAAGPLPNECVGSLETCPLRAVHRFTKRRERSCHVPTCAVRNEDAFKVVQQKMVDSMICCDVIFFATSATPAPHILLLSDDLDVVPAAAVAATQTKSAIHLVRSHAGRENLYDAELRGLGVVLQHWADDD
jgi:hypothetical protein